MPFEKRPEPEIEADPVVKFVIDGIRLSLSQNCMTKEQAEAKIKSWWPEAEIELEVDVNPVADRGNPGIY